MSTNGRHPSLGPSLGTMVPTSSLQPTLSWYPPISSPGFYDSPSDPLLVPYPVIHLLLLRHLRLGLQVTSRGIPPHPCNVAGVSRGRKPITVHLMWLHEFGSLWTRSTRALWIYSKVLWIHSVTCPGTYPSSRIPSSHSILSCSRPLLFETHLIVLPFTLPCRHFTCPMPPVFVHGYHG